ncbi:site-2 protease family protein [Thermanaerosceptrum fracticalcis]|uniref:Site-2 protease family protein n=1 Tax=Thermanaerosceptrum fracticalcis TaxID=1712410 RepID=A0A7G6E0H3_THEFR|nr:site-2 protease family protein [Thermanaerosceptrum fracticalcis]QNB45577.1 site-2 protease family protein [Thermanaerosceptrum fracticalcis]
MLSITKLLIKIPVILIAVTIHEYAHGRMAAFLGDPTPSQQGRLTLNPIPHLDPLGALLLLVAGFGWAKPVEVNPYYFRGNRQRGMMLVALAGPLSNLLVALLGGILYNLFDKYTYLAAFSLALTSINVYLALFNLIPVPPLDGSKIVFGILPRHLHGFLYQLEAYGPLLLMLLIVTNITDFLITPARGIILTILRFGQLIIGS